LLLVIISSSCLKSKKTGIPPEVLQILNNSGIHKPDLLKVILAFQKPEDSVKLKSAYFLIENLESNYYIKITLRDSNEKDVVINFNDFTDYISIKNQIDSIEIISGRLNYRVDSILLDINNVNSEFLIKHINSVITSQKNLWNCNYDIDTYYNFILPYRVANEEIASNNNHSHNLLISEIRKESDILSISMRINKAINKEIIYDSRLEIAPNVQSVSVTEENKSGNWCDINLYKIHVLRSLGIAAALDYTPYFTDSLLGNYTTTVILPDNTEINLPNYENEKEPYPQGKTAKVYRRTFKSIPNSLFSIKDKKTHTPPFLGNYNYLDVTNNYLQTDSVSIDFADTTKYVYLAVYNENSWKPIDWAIAQPDGKAYFYNMGTGIMYMPVVVSKDSIVPIGEPFLLNPRSP